MFGISVHPGREIEARFAQASSINWPITHRCIMERGWETTYLLFQLEISRGKETSAPKSHSEKKKKNGFKMLCQSAERGEKKIIYYHLNGKWAELQWALVICHDYYNSNFCMKYSPTNDSPSRAVRSHRLNTSERRLHDKLLLFLRQDGHSCVWDRQKSRRMGG